MTDSELISGIEKIFELLPPSISELEDKLENDIRFKDEVYIQHIPSVVEDAQSQFLELCVDYGVLPSKYLDGKVSRQGIVGRFLDDCGKKEIYSSWYRFMCIDENYKEWQQPYYTYSQNRVDGYSLNDNPHIRQFFRNQKLDQIL